MITEKQIPTTDMYAYEKHGTGAAAIAAKMIGIESETVSFDLWNFPEDKLFCDARREYKGTVFIGLNFYNGQMGLRVSNKPDLDADGSHALIASWHPLETVTDPAHIAAAIVGYMAAKKIANYFLNTEN